MRNVIQFDYKTFNNEQMRASSSRGGIFDIFMRKHVHWLGRTVLEN